MRFPILSRGMRAGGPARFTLECREDEYERTHKVKIALLASCLLSSVLIAQQPPKIMTRLQVQIQSPEVPADSFAAKPKIIYRAGTQYCRVEEQPDPSNGIHGLMIINEPDAWMVNLATGSAQHIVDPGPSFNCRLPIFSDLVANLPEAESKEILGLEFAQEYEFFKARGATPQPGGVQQGQQTTAYMLKFGESTFALFTYGTPERPLAVAWKRGEKHEIFWYSEYEQMKFEPKLFSKPEKVKIVEAKQ
jgi:hypothetical protein